MSEVKSDLQFVGPIEGGHSGIDGDFMVKNDIIVAVVLTSGDGAIMLNPHLDPEKCHHLIPMIDELTRQAKQVLSGMAVASGQVH